MALRNRINWAVAGSADTPALFMLSPYGVLQPVDSRGIDMGDGSLLNPKRLNGREATYRKMEEAPGWLLGCGPNDGDTDIDLYPPITIVRDLFGAGPDTVCEGDDYRLFDARYPTMHAESHYITGTDHIIPNMIGAVDLTDERLTDKREPRLHAETHSALGEDRLTPFQIGAAPIDHRYPIATNEIRGHVQPDGLSIKVTPNGVIHADPQHIDASKIDSGTIDISRLPKGAIGEIKVVLNNEKRFELTVKDVQNGDTVKVDTTGTMYFIVDDTQLDNEEGYMPYTAYESAFVDWDGVKNKPFEFAAADHAYNHSTSGSDIITPLSIDAADRVHGHVVDEVTGAVTDTDPRLTDSRKPLQHNHTASEITGTVTDDDPRLTDARTPTAHAASHATDGEDYIFPINIDAADREHTHTYDDLSGVPSSTELEDHIDMVGTNSSFGHVKVDGVTIISTDGVLSSLGGGVADAHASMHAIGGDDFVSPTSIGAALSVHTHTATDVANVVQDTDSRLSDSRIPIAHAQSHSVSSTDPITPDSINAADKVHTHTNYTLSSDFVAHTKLGPETTPGHVRIDDDFLKVTSSKGTLTVRSYVKPHSHKNPIMLTGMSYTVPAITDIVTEEMATLYKVPELLGKEYLVFYYAAASLYPGERNVGRKYYEDGESISVTCYPNTYNTTGTYNVPRFCMSSIIIIPTVKSKTIKANGTAHYVLTYNDEHVVRALENCISYRTTDQSLNNYTYGMFLTGNAPHIGYETCRSISGTFVDVVSDRKMLNNRSLARIEYAITPNESIKNLNTASSTFETDWPDEVAVYLYEPEIFDFEELRLWLGWRCAKPSEQNADLLRSMCKLVEVPELLSYARFEVSLFEVLDHRTPKVVNTK